MKAILDSSVILAIIRSEAGEQRALALAQDAWISSVNLGEVITKCIEQNLPEADGIDIVVSCNIEVVPFSEEQAILAGQLRRKAPKGVLSLGDRACLATAILSGRTAVTADKAWTEFDMGCKVELIR
ncbi:MAG: PIN domain-containing protein [Rhizobiaceae bacterium]